MSRKKMVKFNPDEMMKRVRAKVHDTQAVCFTRIANKTEKNVSTVRAWFRQERMPVVCFETLNDWLGTDEPKQIDFNEAGFRDLINRPDVQSSIQKEAENMKFKVSPLRLATDVERRFRSMCDFLDRDASEMLEQIVTEYMKLAGAKIGGF